MFTPSATVQRIIAQSQRPAARPGPGSISLASGDPDFPTPDYIQHALIEAIQQGYTHYADNQGDPYLRLALAERAAQTSGQAVEPGQVVVTHGGSAALSAALLATITPASACCCRSRRTHSTPISYNWSAHNRSSSPRPPIFISTSMPSRLPPSVRR